MNNTVVVAHDVQQALDASAAVVALESTVIAHGLPRPQNLETALGVETVVRENRAHPATIAILEGQLRAGLDRTEIASLAETDGIKKISLRDLPLAMAEKWNGATTVATTCWIANRAGIQVFATGGIGGVHRGSLQDVSGDLPALATTPIIVVCSGAKIVLDLPVTREWLETYGVTVLGYQCDEMPAFYSRRSGLPVDGRVESPEQVAGVFQAQQRLAIQRAILVTVPVPAEFEIPQSDLDRTLDTALKSAECQNISGRNLTPFLLSSMAQASEGETLKANIALLKNNARVAAGIAGALANASVA